MQANDITASTYNQSTASIRSRWVPQRVVSLQPSATVTLAALGLVDRVVACTRYCADVCPEVRTGRLLVADSWTAKSAEILAAHPDLVIAAVPYQLEAVAEILRAGVRFLGLAPLRLADIYTDIATIAGVMGASHRGNEVIIEMQTEIEAVRALIPLDAPRPLVYCEEWGKPLIASQLWVAELIEAAGGRFTGEPCKTTSADVVREANPDVIVAAWCGAGDRVPLETIMRQRNWQGTSAGRSSQVFCINDELLNTPAPTLILGLKALAHAIHPDRFEVPTGIRRIASAFQI